MGLEQKGMRLPGMVHPCPGATGMSHRQGGSTTAPSTPANRVSCTGTEAAPDRQPSGAASDRHGAGWPQPPALLLRRRRTAAAGVRAALRPARLLALLRDAAFSSAPATPLAVTLAGAVWSACVGALLRRLPAEGRPLESRRPPESSLRCPRPSARALPRPISSTNRKSMRRASRLTAITCTSTSSVSA